VWTLQSTRDSRSSDDEPRVSWTCAACAASIARARCVSPTEMDYATCLMSAVVRTLRDLGDALRQSSGGYGASLAWARMHTGNLRQLIDHSDSRRSAVKNASESMDRAVDALDRQDWDAAGRLVEAAVNAICGVDS